MFNTKSDFHVSLDNLIRQALEEDIQSGDVTSETIIPAEQKASGRLVAKADGVIAGLDVARQTFTVLDPAVNFTSFVADGDIVQPGDVLAEVRRQRPCSAQCRAYGP